MIVKQLFEQLFSKNYKVYLLFLILTCLLWFSIQMVKTYNYKSEMFVEVVNIPKHIVIDTSSQKINFNIKANGLNLWSHNLNKNIKISYQDFEKDSIKLIISSNQLRSELSDFFEIGIENVSLNLTSLKFGYQKKQTKIVKIRSDIKYTFSQGYNTLKSLELDPDSVMISGSQKYLDQVDHIQTEKLNLKNVSDTIRGSIRLEKSNPNIDLSKNEVKYYLPVEKYSEKAIRVKIEILNQPDSINMNIFPNQAKVSFLVSLKAFDKISDLDFKVIVDYNKRFKDDAVMIPEFKQYPGNILKPKLHVKKVDYLVRRKSK